MNLRNFRIGWRFLLSEPGYFAVVVLGLATGFAVFFLLVGYVGQSMRYDRHIPGVDQVYVVKTQFNYNGPGGEWWQAAPQVFKTVLDNSGIALEATGFLTLRRSLVVNHTPQEIGVTLVNAAFPQVFGIAGQEGDLVAALSRPEGIALTVDTALRMFGDSHVVGRTLQIGEASYQVMAIVPTPPSTTTFRYEALVGANTLIIPQKFREVLYSSWGALEGGIFVRLPVGVTPAVVEQRLQRAVDQSPLVKSIPPEIKARLGGETLMRVRLGRLADAYFDPEVSPSPTKGAHGDPTILGALLAVAVLILFLSVANYVNLASVRTVRREREIAIRKVLGAGVAQVVRQFMLESVAVSLLATGLGIVLAYSLRPLFAVLVNRSLDDTLGPGMLVFALISGVIVGLLAGIYPAWVASRVAAAQALAGRGDGESLGGRWFRRILTAIQFGTAIVLSAVSLTIVWQSSFAAKLDPGFDPKRLFIVDMPKDQTDPKAIAFRDAVERLPEIAGVTASWDAVARHRVHLVGPMRRDGGAMTTIEYKGIRPNFFQVYGVAAKAGRVFDAKQDEESLDNVVIDSAAARQFGFSGPEAAVDQTLTDDDGKKYRIIGVAADIRFAPVNKHQEAVVYTLQTNTWTLSVRARDTGHTLQTKLQQLWATYFPNDVMRVTPAAAFFELEYAEERRLSDILAFAAVVAFCLGTVGIYVLSAYNVQRRRREIVLRKLYGARPGAIARLIGWEIGLLVCTAALLASPIAYVANEHFLGAYSVRAPLGSLSIFLAIALAASIALIATARHVVAAMRISPSLALRG